MSADSKASNSKFLKGTLILTASSIVVKVIGSLNWIILSRVLGGEGIGLYQMGFPIYLMAITVSSAGVPVAISIITSEKLANKDYRGAKRVFNVSLRVLLLTGLLFSSSLFFGADWLVNNHIIRDSRAYYSIIALAPAVFFVTFLASFRGYLQGWQIMTPTAVSEIVEQLTRVITMLVFADLFMPYGLAFAAGGASMGAGVLALFCFKPQHELGVFLLYLGVMFGWGLAVLLPAGQTGALLGFLMGLYFPLPCSRPSGCAVPCSMWPFPGAAADALRSRSWASCCFWCWVHPPRRYCAASPCWPAWRRYWWCWPGHWRKKSARPGICWQATS